MARAIVVERIDGTPIKNEKEQTGPFSRRCRLPDRSEGQERQEFPKHSHLVHRSSNSRRWKNAWSTLRGTQARRRDSRMADHGGSRAVHALAYPRSDRGIVQCSSLRPRPRGVDKTGSRQIISSWPEAAAVPRSGVRRRFDQRLALVGSEAADTTGLGDRQFFEEFRSLH